VKYLADDKVDEKEFIVQATNVMDAAIFREALQTLNSVKKIFRGKIRIRGTKVIAKLRKNEEE